MLLNAIFSIKPKYAEKIFSGEKKFEFRTKICKHAIDKIIIYETSPVCMVVGEVCVTGIIKDSPSKLWNETKQFAGIEYNSFMEYFKNKKTAFAYVLSTPIKYEKHYKLSEFNIYTAPQSYIYLKNN